MNLKKLDAPFPASNIDWRIQQSGISQAGNPWAMCLAYITNRAIMDRFDEVCGKENWENHFLPGPDGGVLCGISIKCGDKWVTKWDGAGKTEIDPIKGGNSGAMKRAAVQWGPGRYLYNLDAMWAQVAENGINRGTAYKNKTDQKNRQNPVYFKWNPPILPAWALPTPDDMKKKPDPPPLEKELTLPQKLQWFKDNGKIDILKEAYVRLGHDDLATQDDPPIITGKAKQEAVLVACKKIAAEQKAA